MESTNLILLMSLAFGLGMLHALDADHIMAVSGLMVGQQRRRRNFAFCLRWAVGHGLVLVLIGTAIFIFGMHLPDSVSQYAELFVGLILVLLGGVLLLNLYRSRVHLHFHHHDGLPLHAHWHVHEKSGTHSNKNHHHDHAAVFIGVIHGLAGSAPLLVLVPVSSLQSPLYGVIYLLLFSFGVLAAMLLFGGIFVYLQDFMQKQGERAIRVLRLITGSAAIITGVLVIRGVTL